MTDNQPTWEHRVIGWADERRILDGSTCWNQFGKLIEEAGELGVALAEDDRDEIKDGIGDCSVVLAIIACQRGLDLGTCAAFFSDSGDCQLWAQETLPGIAYEKLIVSLGLLADGLTKNKQTSVMVAIGQAMFCLRVIALDKLMPIEDCREAAWEEIKDRRGVCVGGVFVKETVE
jgi:hypothetical protein